MPIFGSAAGFVICARLILQGSQLGCRLDVGTELGQAKRRPEQQQRLAERIAGCCRAISNVALDQRRWFARPGRSISYADQAGEIAALKAEFPWFGEAPYHCLQQVLVDLDAAYKNFLAGRAGAS